MTTSRPIIVETTTAQVYEHEIKRSKVKYAFYLIEQPYDWYLADQVIMSTQIDSPMDEIIGKLKTVIKQAGYLNRGV